MPWKTLADISVMIGNLNDAGAYINQATSMEDAGGSGADASLVLAMGKLAATSVANTRRQKIIFLLAR